MRQAFRIIFSLCILLGMTISVHADEDWRNDSTFSRLYNQFLEYYGSQGHDSEFYQVNKELQDYCLKKGDMNRYYKFMMNECLYDTEHDHTHQAIDKANKMLADMKSRNVQRYDMVYTALGIVFESRGNTGIAMHYFMQAVENLPDDDPGTQMGTFSRLAYLLMIKNPEEAHKWNERYKEQSMDYPPYYQVYLFTEAIITFCKDDKEQFDKVYREYHAFRKSHPELDDYGLKAIEIPRKAFDGQFREALQLLDDPVNDLTDLDRCDLRILILARNGLFEEALLAARQKGQLADSLNSDMLFANLNQINAEAGIAKMQAERAHSHELTFFVVMVAALVIIGLLAFMVYNHRKMSRHLKEKNDQLASALAMAEESDRMKTEFVRSVSHEIRTPLNAISGFNEIINTPGIELSEEERQGLITRINDNMKAITDIVDEMLHVADQNAVSEYAKVDDVMCNRFLQEIIYAYSKKVSSSIELRYTTRIINRFTLRTNADALEKIVNHIVHNAVKFTKKGYIELHCEQEGNNLLISVTDTGCGIPADMQDSIFQQFVKGDSFQQGIGLGLTVSRKMAQKLGGDLMLDKTYTDGARFVLTLPIQ